MWSVDYANDNVDDFSRKDSRSTPEYITFSDEENFVDEYSVLHNKNEELKQNDFLIKFKRE